jgi:hypothetical protein
MPMAIGLSEGADMRRGMALVIIGGLLSSMILTLVLVPVMYSYIEGARVRIPKFLRKIGLIKKAPKQKPVFVDQFEPALSAAMSNGVQVAETV